jgi:hypothetical protein
MPDATEILSHVGLEINENIKAIEELLDRYYMIQSGNTVSEKVLLEVRLLGFATEVSNFRDKIDKLIEVEC